MTSDIKKIKKLILHIGAHKTGTTAIQNFLFFNSDKINKHGFYLPLFLYNEERTPIELRLSIVKKDVQRAEKHLEAIADRANKLCCDTVIISDENYCKVSERDFSTAEVFSRYFDEVIVLMYCRRQDRELESRYAFRVMYHEAKLSDTPEEWYARYKGRDYYKIAKFYEEIIPRSSIKIVSYDQNSKNLIKSFMDVCSIPEDDYVLPSKVDSNISSNKYIVEVMSEANQYFMSDDFFKKVRDYVLNHQMLKDGPKPLFYSMNNRIECQKLFKKNNSKLMKAYYDNQPIFDKMADIKVPSGLSKDIKEKIIKEVISAFNLKYSKRGKSIQTFRKRLAITSDILPVDIFREIGIMCNSHNLKLSAYRFIKYAYYLRGDGPVINRNLEALEKTIDEKYIRDFDYQHDYKWDEKPAYNQETIKKATKRFRRLLRIPFYITNRKIFENIRDFCINYGEPAAGNFINLGKSKHKG